MTLSELKQANVQWFARGNKKFFGDVSYKVLHSKKTGEPYLIRSTYAWSDMLGSKRTLHYRINSIKEDRTIGHLIDNIFSDIYAVKAWLKEN